MKTKRIPTRKTALALGVIAALCSTTLYATDIPLNNPSFENPTQADSTWSTYAPGWAISGGAAGVWNPAVGQTGPCNLGQMNPTQAFVDGVRGSQVGYSNGGDFSQTTGAMVSPGFRYVLRVRVGLRCNLYQNKPYGVILVGGTQNLGTINAVLGTDSWVDQTITYTAGLSDSGYLSVKLMNYDGVQVEFDDVRLQAHKVIMCQGFLAPFDKALSLKKKQSTAIPVKMTLTDQFGTAITDANVGAPPKVQVSVGSDSGSAIAGYEETLLPAGLSDDGNEFRYDPTSQQWIINLATKQYTGSGTYTVKAVAGDDSYVIDPGCSQTFTRQ